MSERPLCDYCGEQVRDRKWYEINGDVICVRCMNENFLKGDADDDEGEEDE